MKRPEGSYLLLYAAYISTCLVDRAWSFCVSLCMDALGGMRMVSIEQLAEGIMQIILSGHLGKAFDEMSRKNAIITVIPFNNLSTTLSACFLTICLSVEVGSAAFISCIICGIITCALNRLFLTAEKCLLGKDWIMVLSNENTLSSFNATLTSIDQLANVVTPIVAGVLVTAWGLRTTSIIIGSLSFFLMFCKAFCLQALYTRKPKLHFKQSAKVKEGENTKSNTGRLMVANAIKIIPLVIITYRRQQVFAAAIAMALLFMTVMGFDGLAIGYGQSLGVPDYIMGGFRSFGAIMGIAGALSYAFFERKLGIRKTGLLGLTCQQICLLVAVISIWLPGSPFDLYEYFREFSFSNWAKNVVQSFSGTNKTVEIPSDIDWNHFETNGRSLDSIFAFLSGISGARFGLWMTDLSIIHIMQEGVSESERNTVFGAHNALCQTFSVLKDILVFVLPDPSIFGLCILISYGFVTSGYAAYVYYLVKHPVDPPSRLTIKRDSTKKDSQDDNEGANWKF